MNTPVAIAQVYVATGQWSKHAMIVMENQYLVKAMVNPALSLTEAVLTVEEDRLKYHTHIS